MTDPARVRARERYERREKDDHYGRGFACTCCEDIGGLLAALDDAARERDEARRERHIAIDRLNKELAEAQAELARVRCAASEAAALRERVAGLEGALRNLIEQNVYRRDSGHTKECICTFCLVMAEAEAALARAI